MADMFGWTPSRGWYYMNHSMGKPVGATSLKLDGSASWDRMDIKDPGDINDPKLKFYDTNYQEYYYW